MKITAKVKIEKCLGNVSKVAGRKACAQGSADHRLGCDVDRPGQLDGLPIPYRKERRSDEWSEEPGGR